MKSMRYVVGAMVSSLLLGVGVTAGTVLMGGNTPTIARAASQADEVTVTLTANDATVDQYGVLTLKTESTVMETLKNGGTLIIPQEIDDVTVTRIAANAFWNRADTPGMTKVILPDSVISIGSRAFSRNQIQEINLDHVEYFGAESFSENRLESVNLTSAKDINNFAFTANRLTHIKLPDDRSNLTILQNAFAFQYFGINEDTTTARTIEVNDANPLSYDTVFEASGVSITSGDQSVINSQDISFSEDFTPSDNVVLNQTERQFENIPDAGTIFYKTMMLSTSELGDYSIQLGIKPVKATPPVVVPPTDGGSTTPDPETSQPETPTPAPVQPDQSAKENYPYAVYAKRTMRLHSNVNFTKPLRSYKKQSRTKAPSFKVLGVAYSKNGAKRYKVKGGYITANPKFVTNLYYQSNTKKIKPIVGNIYGYRQSKFTGSKRIVKYKKGHQLNVRRIVTSGKITRYQLTNGLYVTANKQLVQWTK